MYDAFIWFIRRLKFLLGNNYMYDAFIWFIRRLKWDIGIQIHYQQVITCTNLSLLCNAGFHVLFRKVGLSSMGRVFSCDQAALWTLLSARLSVCLSVCDTFFHYVPLIVSSWNFQQLLRLTELMSIRKVKVRGQRSRSQRSWPHLAVFGL